jgi:hypothetical protein
MNEGFCEAPADLCTSSAATRLCESTADTTTPATLSAKRRQKGGGESHTLAVESSVI